MERRVREFCDRVRNLSPKHFKAFYLTLTENMNDDMPLYAWHNFHNLIEDFQKLKPTEKYSTISEIAHHMSFLMVHDMKKVEQKEQNVCDHKESFGIHCHCPTCGKHLGPPR
jgi:hypothetical protein